MRTLSYLFICIGTVLPSAVYCQSYSELLFKKRTITITEGTFERPSNLFRSSEQSSYYMLVQFEQLPNENQKKSLSKDGILLLNYVPNNAFFASIQPSTDVNSELKAKHRIASIINIPNDIKIDPSISNGAYPLHAQQKVGLLDVTVWFFEHSNDAANRDELEKIGATILLSNTELHTHTVRVPQNSILLLSTIQSVRYIEPIEETDVPENYTSRSLSRASAIDTELPGGLKINGSGVTVTMGDGGDTGWHIDFTGRLTRKYNVYSDHASHVAGTIFGSGNLNPKNKGIASGADLISYNQYDDITAIPTTYTANKVRVTTHSLGTTTTCSGNYTSATVTADRQSNTYPSLLHCFSAGNSGTSDCSNYSPYYSITGGSKAGKNVVTVGNLSDTDLISSSSSCGPTEDGRIKPDICAKGTSVTSTQDANLYGVKSGTSMASPAIAGSLALLHQAYRSLNNNQEAPGALLKSVLLNSADDIGNVGPDFKYGFGRVNLLKAYNLLEKKQYVSGSMSNAGNANHTIAVPSNVGQLKIMLYWSDKDATSGVSKALVNDLDMTVTSPSSQSFLPWVLDHTQNTTTLNSLPTRKADHINNIEQITIDNPASGNYTVNVKGFQIPSGTQTYYIVYEFVQNSIKVVYPNGGEAFVPGETEVIRWDAFGTSGTFTIEYSNNEGNTWTTLSTTVTGSRRYYSWTVPSTASSKAKIRVSRSGLNDISDNNFYVIGVPASLTVSNICNTTSRLSWSSTTGATRYEVSKLGTKYMDSVTTTTNLYFDIPSTLSKEEWYSVRAVFADGSKGRRAIAVSRAANAALSCNANIPPLVSITSPSNNSTIAQGTQITLNANASDAGGISKVEFYHGSTLIGTDNASPFSITNWTPTQGQYILTAKAYDNLNLSTTSASVTLNVSVTTGTEESINELSSQVYPNPTKGIIKFDPSITALALVDARGQMIRTIQTTDIQADISTLPSGMYFLQIRQSDEIKYLKIVKE